MYKLNTAVINAPKCSQRKFAVGNPVAAQQQKQGNGNGPENIHQRRTHRRRRHRAQICPEEPLGSLAKARHLPGLHAEGLYDPVAGDGFLQDVLDVGQFVLPAARGVPHPASDLSRRVDDERDKQQQHPGKFPPQHDHRDGGEQKGKELLQKFRQHARHGVLHSLDVVDDGRDQRPRGVLLKKRRRAPQHGVVQIVAQVGDHAESGMVHQISAGIIENAFQDRGRDQRVRHNRPGIVKMCGNELLQVDDVPAAGNGEQLDVVRSGRWIQDAVKDRPDQHQPKRLEEPNRRQQQHARQQLQPKRKHIA